MSDGADELQVLLDKSRITELLTRYLRGIDRGDIDALRSCYLAGATEEHGGLYSGPAQGYVDSIEQALRNPRSVATHSLSNVLVDTDGDRARSEHYVLALTRVKVSGVVTDHLVASRIVDDLQRTGDGWRIARRRLRFDWSQKLGPRPERWLDGSLDPATLLHGAKFPDDPVYEPMPAPLSDTVGAHGGGQP